MTLLRRIVFYILLLVYLTTCPLVILYALGYSYKPGHDPSIAKMGVISLSTIPSGAAVYLGRSRFTEKTPTVLMDLYPGEYVLKIIHEDYRPWMRKVPVHSGKATILEDIFLVPNNLHTETMVPDSFNDLTILPQTSFLLLSKGTKLKDLYVLNWRRGKPRPLLPVDSRYSEVRLMDISSVRKSPSLVLGVKGKLGETYLRLNLRGSHTRVKDLSGLLDGGSPVWNWDPKAENQLYFIDSGRLSRIDLASRGVTKNLAEQVRGVGLFDRKVYVIRPDDVIRMDRGGEEVESLLNDPELGKSLFEGDDIFHLERLEDGVLIFWKKGGELLSNRFPYRLVEDGVLGLEPKKGEPLLLVWQKNRIGVIDFSRPLPESDDAFEKGVKPRWVYASGANIQQAFWVSDSAHILFRDAAGIYLLEAFPGVESSVRYLLSVKEKSSVFYAEAIGKLYYLEPQFGKLSTIELFAKDLLAPMRRSLESDSATARKVKDGLSIFQSRPE